MGTGGHGLPAALGILLLRSVLKLLLNSQGVNTYIGLPMNIVALGVFCHRICFDLEKGTDTPSFPTRISSWNYWLDRGYVVLNYVYAVPLYAKFANFDIGKIFGTFQLPMDHGITF